MTHLSGTPSNIPSFNTTSTNDRGSCSADSGVRGSSDRESTTGDLNLSDGACENGPCITVDPDSISLVSSQHMYQCMSKCFTFMQIIKIIEFLFYLA